MLLRKAAVGGPRGRGTHVARGQPRAPCWAPASCAGGAWVDLDARPPSCVSSASCRTTTCWSKSSCRAGGRRAREARPAALAFLAATRPCAWLHAWPVARVWCLLAVWPSGQSAAADPPRPGRSGTWGSGTYDSVNNCGSPELYGWQADALTQALQASAGAQRGGTQGECWHSARACACPGEAVS
jgi:hypothetical protein